MKVKKGERKLSFKEMSNDFKQKVIGRKGISLERIMYT